MYQSVLSQPHSAPTCTSTPSAEISNPPCLMRGSTPQSSSLAPTPMQPVPDSVCKILQENLEILGRELSQDPLLLSPGMDMKGMSDVDIPEISSSPVESQLSSMLYPCIEGASSSHVSSPSGYSIFSPGQERSQSMDPLYLFRSPPKSPNDLVLPTGQESRDLAHIPIIKEEVCLVSPHPLRPSPLASPSPCLNITLPMVISDATLDGSASNSAGTTNQNVANEHANLTELILISDEPRYSLRHRGAKQLKPYTVEQFQYKQALSANPDAIVKFHGGRRYSDAEGRNIWELPGQDCTEDGGNWEESRPRRAKISTNGRSKSPEVSIIAQDTSTLVAYPAILQDLSSTDEDEAKELRALSKEARKMERGRRSKKRQKRVKSVPPSSSHGRSAHETTTPHLHLYNVRMSRVCAYPTRAHKFNQDRSEHLRSVQCSPSSPNPPMSRTRRSTTPVLTSYSLGTWEEHTPPRTTTPDIEGLAIAENMDIDGPDSATHSTAESSDSGQSKTMLDRKGMKALQRMMPKSLVTRFMHADNGPQRPRQLHLAIDNDRADSTLLPGRTRVRWAEKPRGAGEIKGDSESSGDERSSVAESLLQDKTLRSLSGPRSPKHSNEHTIELTDTSDDSESSSSDDGVDDEEIQIFLDPDKRRKSKEPLAVREESLVDWMLAKTRTIGTPRKPSVRRRASDGDQRWTKAKSKSKSKSKYKIDIHTRGSRRLGPERQTTLNFRHFSDENFFPPKDDGFHPSRTSVSSSHGFDTNPRVMRDYNVSKERARKIKAEERRRRAKTNGLYTFSSGETHAVTGGRKTVMVSVNLEDEDFHMALAPSQNRIEPLHLAHVECNTRKARSSTLHLNEQPGYGHTGTSNTDHATVQRIPLEKSGVYRDIHDDSILYSGLSFGPDTFIGRGWLHDLLREISSPADVTMPAAFTFRGSELGSSTSVEKLCDSLRDLINHFFHLACDLPELDQEPADKDLTRVTHLLCKLLSWFLAISSVDDHSFVLNTVRNEISQSLARLREISNFNASLDTSTLSICWLMVELSARLGHSVTESVSWLVHNLLEYGLPQTMAAVREDNILDGSTTAQYTAELWVRLFHILDHYDSRNTEKPHIHLFWVAIMESMKSGELSKHSLESSEAMWGTIFSLCALTQFSVHGMTTATSRLPACWEFVVSALKTIRLTADPQIDRELSAPSLDKRDKYLGLITLRCFRLWSRWRWRLDGASILFNQLVDIFKSRKFANLRHEVADFPDFMLKGDWDLLSSYRHGDTAFVLFLKLMFHATRNDKTDPNRAISPTTKKLLSLAIPVGSLPFSGNSVTHVQDLSMLFNRFSAVAIGIYLDRRNHFSRITHARTYVKFSEADDSTRLAVMRGMMNLGILMKNCDVPLDGVADWTKEMADALADEFKTIPKIISPAENNLRIRKDRLVIFVQCLLCCVRRIMETYKNISQYPEPALLSKLTFSILNLILSHDKTASCSRILLNTSLTNVDKTAQQVLGLAGNLFSARAMSLPPPARPLLAPMKVQESQESQDDYGGMDLDFDDPALRAALGDDVQLPTPADYKPKEEALRKVYIIAIYRQP